MRRGFMALVALCISCHAPTSSAQYRLSEDSDTSQIALIAPDDKPVLVATHAAAPRRRVSPEPRAAEDTDGVELCCDIPSGLCWRASESACESPTSERETCPCERVREVNPAGDILVCAD